jgi:Zn-dependent peptidase ImmA (M78 family)
MHIEGRQILSAEYIEERTEQLLVHYNPNYFDYVKATPLMEIIDFLREKHQVIFRFDDYLGFSERGERILGATNPKKRVILVDASLKADEHKFNFTLAHELGHLALHRKLKIVYNDAADEGSETINERLGNSKNFKTEADWMEWQANYYASALLMPKQTFIAGLVLQQRELGISRVGKIFIDDQRTNQADYWKLLSMLSKFFRVSQMAVEIRLHKLNLIDDRRNCKSLRGIIENLGF